MPVTCNVAALSSTDPEILTFNKGGYLVCVRTYTDRNEIDVGAVYVESGGYTCTKKHAEPEETGIGAVYVASGEQTVYE